MTDTVKGNPEATASSPVRVGSSLLTTPGRFGVRAVNM